MSIMNMPDRRTLTDREIEVLQWVAEGLSNKEIARKMNLSPMTVKTHLTRIGHIAGVTSRAGLVGWGFRNGVLK